MTFDLDLDLDLGLTIDQDWIETIELDTEVDVVCTLF